jgi:hypothetical protein
MDSFQKLGDLVTDILRERRLPLPWAIRLEQEPWILRSLWHACRDPNALGWLELWRGHARPLARGLVVAAQRLNRHWRHFSAFRVDSGRWLQEYAHQLRACPPRAWQDAYCTELIYLEEDRARIATALRYALKCAGVAAPTREELLEIDLDR